MDQTKKPKSAQELFEEDQKKTEEAIKYYNIDDFVINTEQVFTVEIPPFNPVQFKHLTFAEAREVHQKCKQKAINDPDLVGIYIIAAMMRKADLKTTPEKLLAKSMIEVTALSNAVGRHQVFFDPKKTLIKSTVGSKTP